MFTTQVPQLVAKVYHATQLTPERHAKLDLMLRQGASITGRSTSHICWPRGLLRDSTGVFRGFVMDRGKGVALSNSVFLPSVAHGDWKWSRTLLVRVLGALLREIALLHESQTLVGDLNGNNILTTASAAVSLVDCDSYQVGCFPCAVGTPEFTPPELHNTRFATTLRTPEHEAFAVAVLGFRVLFLGKQPYAQPGSASLMANHLQMRFPYTLSSRDIGNPPMGPWLHIWNNLSPALREAFVNVFDSTHRGERRPTVHDWIALIDEYGQLLADGQLPPDLLPQPQTKSKRGWIAALFSL